jgi:hypothetical protein
MEYLEEDFCSQMLKLGKDFKSLEKYPRHDFDYYNTFLWWNGIIPIDDKYQFSKIISQDKALFDHLCRNVEKYHNKYAKIPPNEFLCQK